MPRRRYRPIIVHVRGTWRAVVLDTHTCRYLLRRIDGDSFARLVGKTRARIIRSRVRRIDPKQLGRITPATFPNFVWRTLLNPYPGLVYIGRID